MPLWAAALLFALFATASAFSFLKRGKNNDGVRFYAGVLFALIGVLVFAYAAATVFFVGSME